MEYLRIIKKIKSMRSISKLKYMHYQYTTNSIFEKKYTQQELSSIIELIEMRLEHLEKIEGYL